MADSKEVMRNGELLESLKLHSGYKVLINDIVFPLYADAMQVLEEREDQEARATIKVIKNIVAKIDDTINLSKQLQEEYKREVERHVGYSE